MLELQLSLSHSQLKTLREHAQHEAPLEACALLFGTKNGDSYTVNKVVTTSNAHKSQASFRIAIEEMFRAVKQGEQNGNSLIGTFHSHPCPPKPSSIDLENMRRANGLVWLIMSPYNTMGAYLLVNNKPAGIAIKLRKEPKK